MTDRLLAYVIDFVLLTVASFALWVVQFVLGLVIGFVLGNDGLANLVGGIILSLLLWVAIGAVVFAYFTYLDGASSGTLGKRLMDVVVAKNDGSPATTKDTAIRTAVLLVPFPVMVLLSIVPVIGIIGFPIAIGLMVLWLVIEAAVMVVSDDHRRLGDRAAGTRVLKRGSAAGAGAGTAAGETATAGGTTSHGRRRHDVDEFEEEPEAEAAHDEGYDSGGYDSGGGFGGGDGGGGGGE